MLIGPFFMVNYCNWSNNCKSLLAGHDDLFDELILNFIEKRSKFKGFHGIVLDGISGSGKTTLGRVIEKTCPFETIFKNCTEIFINSKVGGPEGEIKNIFKVEPNDLPLLIILDDSECLFGSHINSQFLDSELVGFSFDSIPIERKTFLLAKHLMDKINREENRSVFVIAITPERGLLEGEIKFPGRLNHFLNMNLSKYQQREALLKSLLFSWPFESEFVRENCIKIISGQPTSGFTPADLENFLQRTWEMKTVQVVTIDDFLKARRLVNPSSIVARLAKHPSVVNVNIIGLEQQLFTIQQYLSAIFRNDKSLPLPRGVLLEGPSGCGKSLLASKLSEIPFKLDDLEGNSISFPVNFISVDSTQIVSKYFGQSDRNLSRIFTEARQAAPCILFFDQIDSLVGRRSSNRSGSEERLVTTFLVEMDGLKSKLNSIEGNGTVIVLGASNKKHLIDPAILRPGRLDLHVNVPIPDRNCRYQFIETFTRNGRYNLSALEIKTILDETETFSYADLDSIFKEAAMTALRQDINCTTVEYRHFSIKK